MKILSIDVGIKNLAVCLFEKKDGSDYFRIAKWDVINIAEAETFKCEVVDKNKNCNSVAKYTKNGNCFCLKQILIDSFIYLKYISLSLFFSCSVWLI